MPFSGDTRHFLGMTKSTFFYIMVVWVIGLTTFFAISSIVRDNRIEKAVDLGRQAHAANCALKDDLEARVKDGQEALARSKALVEKNPNLIPGVSQAVWQQTWAAQQRSIDGQTRTIILLDKALSCGAD
jgi:hypothetical protein